MGVHKSGMTFNSVPFKGINKSFAVRLVFNFP
jgi:hypothetical protein